MADIEDGTAQEQPADDIRSALTAAVTESETPAAVAETGAAVAKPDAAPADGSATEDVVRGPDGKFRKKDAAPAEGSAAAKPAAGKAAQDPAAAAAAAAAPAAADSKDPPAHWSAADKATFAAQPPAAQAFLLDRFKAMEGDYTKKTQAVAALKNEYGPVDEMFAPHKDVMRQKGFTPRSLIESWANVETKLAGSPDSAIEVIRGLVSGYNIPVDKLAGALGISKAQAAAAADGQQQPTAVENGQQVALPPEVARELAQLRETVGQFGQKFQTIEQRDAQVLRARELEQEQAAENAVNEFRNSVDEKGSLLHPHMADVEGMMTALANAALASKQAVPSLKELYETAVYATPSTREKVLTAQKQQEEAERNEAARSKAAAARKAGSSVNGAPGSGQAPTGKSTADLSLREQLEEAAEDAA